MRVARSERKGWLAFNASVVDASNRGGWGSFARARGERGGRDARERGSGRGLGDAGKRDARANVRLTPRSRRVAHRELHKNPDVVFAGYKNPHPTDHRIVLKVHTNANTTPVQALRDAVTNLRAEVSDVAQQFSDEINAIRRE